MGGQCGRSPALTEGSHSVPRPISLRIASVWSQATETSFFICGQSKVIALSVAVHSAVLSCVLGHSDTTHSVEVFLAVLSPTGVHASLGQPSSLRPPLPRRQAAAAMELASVAWARCPPRCHWHRLPSGNSCYSTHWVVHSMSHEDILGTSRTARCAAAA